MPESPSGLSVHDLVERLSASAPVPGGGSAAALAGALGAALLEMVVALSVDRPSAAGHEGALASMAVRAGKLRDELLDLVDADAEAYQGVIAARRLPRDTDAERAARDERVAEATRQAILAPLHTARAASTALGLASELAPIGNRNAISDVGVAALLAAAAVRGAALNVRINLPSLSADDPLADAAARQVRELLGGLDAVEADVVRTVDERIG